MIMPETNEPQARSARKRMFVVLDSRHLESDFRVGMVAVSRGVDANGVPRRMEL